MKEKPILTLMCGIARSGKSTWIEKNKKDELIVSPDEIRRVIFGHQFHQNAEPFVWSFAEGMARMLLEQGKSVIVDATNVTNFGRNRWILLARDYNIKTRIIFIQTPLKECLARNEKSPEGKKVPEDALIRMDRSLKKEPPYESEKYQVEIVRVED